jgi:hypothetical protein
MSVRKLVNPVKRIFLLKPKNLFSFFDVTRLFHTVYKNNSTKEKSEKIIQILQPIEIQYS